MAYVTQMSTTVALVQVDQKPSLIHQSLVIIRTLANSSTRNKAAFAVAPQATRPNQINASSNQVLSCQLRMISYEGNARTDSRPGQGLENATPAIFGSKADVDSGFTSDCAALFFFFFGGGPPPFWGGGGGGRGDYQDKRTRNTTI